MKSIRRIPRELDGVPSWGAIPVLMAAFFLICAVFGLFWDIAYHVDHGRDANLFTAPHVMILIGLLGLAAIAAATVVLATVQEADTGLRFRGLRIPYVAPAFIFLAGGALIGFPLDDEWHRLYGIDVTLWSPTHLLMIGGAVLTTFALPLLARESGSLEPPGTLLMRLRRLSMAGALPLGLSVFLLEFDYGVPQWQAVYHPLILALLSALTLVAVRAMLGPGGALKATAWFIVMRVLLALFVVAQGHTFPAFPLLAVSALCVELVFLLEDRVPALALSLLAGAAVGTVGLASEWAWSQVIDPFPWHLSLLPRIWLPVAAALASAPVGLAYGRVVSGRKAGIPGPLSGLLLLALAILLAIPLTRTAEPLSAHLETTPVSDWRTVTDRYGRPASVHDVAVTVQLDRPEAARGADWFVLTAWQGGGRQVVQLKETSPGHFRAVSPISTGGAWKAIVFLASGDKLMAAPVYFPPDPQYGNPGVPERPSSDVQFVTSDRLITSESHGGPAWFKVVGYGALLATTLAWVLGLAWAAGRLSSQGAATSAVSPKRSKPRFSSRPA